MFQRKHETHLLGVLGVSLALLAACETSPAPSLTVQEKAQKVARLRREAEACLEAFQRSENDPEGVDVEALECFADRHRQTAELFPNPGMCPICYANYGRGLLMLGKYHWSLREKFKERLSESPPSLRTELEEKVARFDKLMQENLRQSVQQFLASFRGGGTDYRSYQFTMEACFLLEDYRRALHYLDLWAQSAPLTERDKERVKRWRERWQKLYQRQQLERYSQEVEN